MGPETDAAWLSSARAVRCSVKSGNERNPCRQLPSGYAGDSGGTARVKREEGVDDVKSVWLLRLGPQTCYNGGYRAQRVREAPRTAKARPSSDCPLNTFPGLVHTARHIMGADHTRRRRADPRGGQSTKVGPVTGMKS